MACLSAFNALPPPPPSASNWYVFVDWRTCKTQRRSSAVAAAAAAEFRCRGDDDFGTGFSVRTAPPESHGKIVFATTTRASVRCRSGRSCWHRIAHGIPNSIHRSRRRRRTSTAAAAARRSRERRTSISIMMRAHVRAHARVHTCVPYGLCVLRTHARTHWPFFTVNVCVVHDLISTTAAAQRQ